MLALRADSSRHATPMQRGPAIGDRRCPSEGSPLLRRTTLRQRRVVASDGPLANLQTMLVALAWIGGVGALVTFVWFLFWLFVERPRKPSPTSTSSHTTQRIRAGSESQNNQVAGDLNIHAGPSATNSASQQGAPKVKPLVYADDAAITGSNNVDVQLHNESDHLATNIHAELRQGNTVIGTKSVPEVAGHEVPPRTDLLPSGTGGQFVRTGLEWTSTCTYQGSDGSSWRSVWVSGTGNAESTLHFAELYLGPLGV